MEKLALISHDEKKKQMVSFALKYKDKLRDRNVLATGTTGKLIEDAVGMTIERVASGPLGGDAQIAAQIVEGKVAAVIFFVDPLSSHPHDPDIHGLLRICMVYNIPLALNVASAEILLAGM